MLKLIHRSYLTSLSTSVTRRTISTTAITQNAQHRETSNSPTVNLPVLHPASRSNTEPIEFNPFSYTSGRWLKHDKLQRKARHIEFDFSALCKKAIQACPGATRIAKQEKKEGSYNRAFLLHIDNGARVVARVPFRVAGPRRLTTNSEVATMAYST